MFDNVFDSLSSKYKQQEFFRSTKHLVEPKPIIIKEKNLGIFIYIN
jgi:hypothetical protein